MKDTWYSADRTYSKKQPEPKPVGTSPLEKAVEEIVRLVARARRTAAKPLIHIGAAMKFHAFLLGTNKEQKRRGVALCSFSMHPSWLE
jgi:hypothetical protein